MLLYKPAEQLASGLGRFLECWKYNMLPITQALVLRQIYTHSPSGIAALYQVNLKLLLPMFKLTHVASCYYIQL